MLYVNNLLCDRIRRSGLLLLLVSCVAVLTHGWSLPRQALASSDSQVLLNLPIYSSVDSKDLIRQAESMVADEIARRFRLDADLADIKVTVLGSRNGDIAPILSTAVSRADWQENSAVSVWTEYYRSHALFRRHDRAEPVATAATRSGSTLYADVSAQIDRQHDAGLLRGGYAQAYLDELD